MKLCERPIDTLREFLADPETNIPSKVYNAILLAVELIDRDAVFALLDDHGNAELVVTGRDPCAELLERADYVTEMKLMKHPYEKGVKARKGIEF